LSLLRKQIRAFLYFSIDRRVELKLKYPGIPNTEVARLLGEIWRQASFEEKEKYRAIEKIAREKYKRLIDDWKIKEANSKSTLEAPQKIKTKDSLIIHREEQQAEFNIQKFQVNTLQPSQNYTSSNPNDRAWRKWMATAYEGTNRRNRFKMLQFS